MITGRTRVAAVIGDPITHSLSPELHNAAFRATGLDWVFVAWPVAAGDGAAAVAAMRTVGLAGMSVTTPHKDAVIAAADETSPAVDALGAANCLVPVDGGRIRAENTDGAGFLAGLHDDTGATVDDRRIGLIGAGGAGRAIAHAAGAAGAAAVVVVNRTPERARAAADLAGPAGRVGEPADLAGVDIVVNCTTVGMGDDGGMPCDPALLRAGQTIVDIVYSPWETPWLRAARAAGVEAFNGASMLVHQAAIAFTLWTGVDAPVSAMRKVVANKVVGNKFP